MIRNKDRAHSVSSLPVAVAARAPCGSRLLLSTQLGYKRILRARAFSRALSLPHYSATLLPVAKEVLLRLYWLFIPVYTTASSNHTVHLHTGMELLNRYPIKVPLPFCSPGGFAMQGCISIFKEFPRAAGDRCTLKLIISGAFVSLYIQIQPK